MVKYTYHGFPGDSNGKVSVCNVGDLGSIPGLGRSPGGGHGNPLQYSCRENPMDREAWQAYSPWGRKEYNTTEQLNTTFDFQLRSGNDTILSKRSSRSKIKHFVSCLIHFNPSSISVN